MCKGIQRSRKANLKLKIRNLIAALALVLGESMDRGEARMALRVTCQVIEAANPMSDVDAKRAQSLHVASYMPLNLREARPPHSSAISTLVESDGATFDIDDPLKRGLGNNV
jgi:hypothetical protein